MVNQLLIILPLIITLANLTLVAPKSNVHKKIDANQSDDRGFISIDCGAKEEYVDPKTGILYKPDTDFVQGGRVYTVNPPADSSFQRQLITLRSFPTERRSCYTLRPKQGKDNKYLIRAAFFHGRYDTNTQGPSFNLYIGANVWTVVSQVDADHDFFYEIIHTASTDTIYVCLVNTGGGAPFISSLELRPVSKSIYEIASHSLALQTLERLDVGASSDLYMGNRYKEDVYDRVWLNYNSVISSCAFSNTSVDIDTDGSSNAYRLPAQVLRTAIQPATLSKSLFVNGTIDKHNEYCVYFHFAEIQLTPGQRRMINITVNGESFLSKPITLEYLKPLTISTNITAREFVSINFSPAAGSDLPPILNAFEILALLPQPNLPTDTRDGMVMLSLKSKIHMESLELIGKGTHVFRVSLMWSGLNCRNDNGARIISVDLSSSKLRGEISSSFSKLTELESLDLSLNELIGPVPESLAQLQSLRILLDENPKPCLRGSCKGKRKKVGVIAVASTVTVLVSIILLVLAIIWNHKRSKKRETVYNYNGGRPLKFKSQSFKYSEIVKITDNFSSLIGEGGFGKVYHGTLKDDFQVAVKLLSSSSRQGSKEFQNEVKSMLRAHHKNLLSLIGYCNEGDNMALVYEYMENGTLEQHLSFDCNNVLTWIRRLQVAIDAARGLDYLHNGCRPTIIHRDIKTSNILLDKNFQAKISDFGLSKAFETESCTHVSTDPKGTFGYFDPQYYNTKKLNRESDIYSFGIVLLEMITGQTAIIRDLGPAPIHIIQWVSLNFGRMDIGSIVDPRIQISYNISSAGKAMEIAMACVHSTAIQRPNASLVYSELRECLKIELASENINDNEEICSNCSSELSPR
ncbi:protein kinase family protein [Quillaja saponaria]|uniref:Protein kinase family protein n=1 Tax=Quillaja saponaria TaxID=32244 RepID=A0AAD7PP76_QUISA|nr:protein kinase family protein [Quillaja saponaria]